MAEDEKPELPAQLSSLIISNAELDRLIADLVTNPLAKGDLRQVGQGIYVPEPIAAGKSRLRTLPEFGRTNVLFFRQAGDLPLFNLFRREPHCLLSSLIRDARQFSADMRLIYPLSSFRKSISGEYGFDHHRVVPARG
jgi:hypothetical protein